MQVYKISENGASSLICQNPDICWSSLSNNSSRPHSLSVYICVIYSCKLHLLYIHTSVYIMTSWILHEQDEGVNLCAHQFVAFVA